MRSTPQAVHAPPYAFVMDCDSAPRRPARLPAAFFPESRDGTGESGAVRVRRARAQRERVYREGVGTHQSNARTLHGSSQKGLLASGMRSRRLANSCDHGSIEGWGARVGLAQVAHQVAQRRAQQPSGARQRTFRGSLASAARASDVARGHATGLTRGSRRGPGELAGSKKPRRRRAKGGARDLQPLRTEMKRFIGVFTMSHENNGVRALPPETFETGERFRTPFLVCEDKISMKRL